MLSFLYDNLLTIMQLVVLFVSIYISFTPHIKRIFVADFIVNVSLLAWAMSRPLSCMSVYRFDRSSTYTKIGC